jgi:hypothetical protein
MPELIVWVLGLQRFDERPVDIQARIGYVQTVVDERATSEITTA